MGRLKEQISIEEVESKYDIKDIVSRYTTLNSYRKGYRGTCPFHVEKTPSFYLYENGMFKCFGCGEGGVGVVSFVMKKEKLNYTDSIEFIKSNGLVSSKKIITREQIKKQFITYDFTETPFTDKHKRYFEEGGLSEDFLKKEGDIYAVKKYAINKKLQYIKDNQFMFAYVHKDYTGKETGGIKFLTLGKGVTKQDKWRTNVPNTQLWYLYKYVKEPKIFIVKSNKDALINMLCGIPSIATQSENGKILSDNIKNLKRLYPNTEFIINFGSDEQGVNESKKVSKEYDLKWFNIPKNLLINGINDNFEYVKYFGLNNYKKLLNKYGFLDL